MVYYEPGKTHHGLPRDPFKACVTPRPIGWISTRSKDGIDNLAPYSQFNNLTFDPPFVMFCANSNFDTTPKDSVVNAEQSRVFCWNVATWELRESVNATSEWFTPDIDEFQVAGLEKEEATVVNAPMVKESPIKFECEYYTTMRIRGNPPAGSADIVVGRVVAVHIDDRVITDGKVDLLKVKPIARCGYLQYIVIKEDAIFEMKIPGDPKQLIGLEGNATLTQKLKKDKNTNFVNAIANVVEEVKAESAPLSAEDKDEPTVPVEEVKAETVLPVEEVKAETVLPVEEVMTDAPVLVEEVKIETVFPTEEAKIEPEISTQAMDLPSKSNTFATVRAVEIAH